jgi:hypothetical protein
MEIDRDVQRNEFLSGRIIEFIYTVNQLKLNIKENIPYDKN